MSNDEVEINYEKLANTIVIALQKGGQILRAGPIKTFGIATITSDNCEYIRFNCGNRNYGFEKDGKASWIETVKYSHRHKANIEVIDNGNTTNPDGSYVPTDIHDA